MTLNYTLSRNQTDATNDRDAIDIPQNPPNPDADYADARTDRRHIFNGSFTYELPFFRDAGGCRKAVLGGWQVAGIVNISSGQPVSRILVLSDTFRRGVFADLVGDPNGRRALRQRHSVLVQPGCVRAAGGGHVRQLRPRAVPPAGPPPVGPQLLEELLSHRARCACSSGPS